ncbi:stearoyl-CoA 9-desaturase [Entomophthora muscae]|uniref:Stearoyl-CoA 9-desaturase n=1 Tax=Entomophthora muscae TaxID=34485 RepID=A0ACC2UPH5_9FUNG|nr:stearoyl-CoA 9-desaturase [Entomophthora muscae]
MARQKKTPLSERPLWQQINWPQSILLAITPVMALYGILTTELQFKTFIFSLVYYVISALGITAGYHRYYSHRSYQASLPYQVYIMLAGTASVQGSILWWSRDHRVHHRFTDTEKDPYNAKRGFIWSHIGWMIYKKDSTVIGRAEVDDLEADPIVMFQHNYYVPLALFMSFILPTLVAGILWGDWKGGYYYVGIARLVFVHHATFCINSLAHWIGDASFDDKLSPRDYILTALITMGEGYHNFHHEFPQDYRNAIKFFQYDPTKWFIYACSLVGLTCDLKIFPDNEVRKGELLMKEKNLNKVRATINWGVPIETLPVISFEQYQKECDGGKRWLLIDGVVHDVEEFMHEHPGGIKYIRAYIGKDSTAAFGGQVYDHSNAARNLMSSMRVARVSQ